MTKEERMGSAPIGQLMFQLALPAVAAQFINMLYNYTIYFHYIIFTYTIKYRYINTWCSIRIYNI